MKKTRTLLFYSQNGGIYPYMFYDLEISKTLEEALKAVLIALSAEKETKDIPEKPADYDLYDWQLQKLLHNETVGEVPKPGIVIAVRKGHEEIPGLTFGLALRIKMMALTLEDPINRRFLDSFLRGSESQFEPVTQFTYDVFLSYAHVDRALASEISSSLSNKEIKCFMAEKDISGGMIWEDKILSALKKAKMAIILLTPESKDSRWVMCEAGALWALGKPMVPAIVYIEINDMPEPIKKYQAIEIETSNGRLKLYDEVTYLCGIL